MATDRAARLIRLRLRAMLNRRDIEPAHAARIRKALRDIARAESPAEVRAAVERVLRVVVDGGRRRDNED